jgi:hypothetical protein
MRSKTINGHSNQCVYDRYGKLIRTPPGHGTVDWRRPSVLPPHYNHDVHPIIHAAKLDGCWEGGFPIGRIFPGCVGANMRKYFNLRPLHAEEPSFPEKDPCCDD